jgi:hypothetical protein
MFKIGQYVHRNDVTAPHIRRIIAIYNGMIEAESVRSGTAGWYSPTELRPLKEPFYSAVSLLLKNGKILRNYVPYELNEQDQVTHYLCRDTGRTYHKSQILSIWCGK